MPQRGAQAQLARAELCCVSGQGCDRVRRARRRDAGGRRDRVSWVGGEESYGGDVVISMRDGEAGGQWVRLPSDVATRLGIMVDGAGIVQAARRVGLTTGALRVALAG